MSIVITRATTEHYKDVEVCKIKVDEDFTYCSDNNKDWMSIDTLKDWIEKNYNKIGSI